MPSFRDYSGRRFGRLLVIRRVEGVSTSGARWLCQCDCGKNHTVSGRNLRSGSTSSCGCLRRQVSLVHLAAHRTTHGKSYSREYGVWKAMIARCSKPNHPEYARYGGRGIMVCKEWAESFSAFYRDMGDRPSGSHSLDRADPNGHYTKDNCQWATTATQARNRRNVLRIDIDGVSRTLSEWSAISGVPKAVISTRLYRGMALRDCVFQFHRKKSAKSDADAASRKSIKAIWDSMKHRCTSPNSISYQAYGGRGIKVCKRWIDSFENFAADIGPRPSAKHSLDRIDTDGDYSPENCRWATSSQQGRNRRGVRAMTCGGITLSLCAWAKRIGIGKRTLTVRLDVLGWSVEEALTIPKGGRRKDYKANVHLVGITDVKQGEG